MEHEIKFYVICCFLLFAIITAFFYLLHLYRKIKAAIEYLTKKAVALEEGRYEDTLITHDMAEIRYLENVFNKMTKRLRIERDLVESQKEQLNSILTSMNSGIVAIENSGKILFYNQPFVKFIHCEEVDKKETLLGKSFYEFYSNKDIADLISIIQEEEHPVRREISLGEKDNGKILLVKGTPLYKKSKRNVGTLLIMEDITRMKKLETFRKDFVSNVTHELKTPLTSIRGFVETLKAGAIEDPEYACRFLDIIDIEAERLSILVNDILILSEIESGRETGKAMVNVESVIDEVIDLLKEKKKDSVTVVKEMEKPVTDYLCNRDRLKELVLNLADNGVKYTNEGTVIIRCWEEEQDLMFQFADSGVGIPKEHLPRLFERFYRVDKGRSRKQGGTGLGLSIVKHIAELYHGSIEVESEAGKGTIFTVRLPYYR